MNVLLRTVLVGLPLWLLEACGQSPGASTSAGDLPEGVVARVGGDLIGEEELEAAGGRSSRSVARDLVADTLLAVEARARDRHLAAVVERGVLSRALLESIRAEHLAASPPQAVELERAVSKNWLLYDRPRAVRAVVARVAVPMMGRDEPYAAEAHRIARECSGSLTVNELKTCVNRGDVSVDLLRAPPLDAAGRVVPAHTADRTLALPTESMARAIGRLRAPGDTTAVFAGQDDYQVAVALEVIPADSIDTPEEQQQLLAGMVSDDVRRKAAAVVARSAVQVKRSQKNEAALLRLVWRQ